MQYIFNHIWIVEVLLAVPGVGITFFVVETIQNFQLFFIFWDTR